MNLAALLPRLLKLGFQPLLLQAARPTLRTLANQAVMTLENRPLQLRVLRGCVWITRDGEPADTVLGAGGLFEQRPGARVLVQALEDAELLIAAAGANAQNARTAAF